jgi:hypothetical protein
MIEVWMGGNEEIYKKQREDLEFWVYNKPCKEVKECLLLLIKKMQEYVDISKLRVESTRGKAEDRGYLDLREKLYGFVKMDFEYGDLAELEFIVDVWLTYITPWLKPGQEFTVELW